MLPWTATLRALTASWPRYPGEDTGRIWMANLRAGHAAGAFLVRGPDSAAAVRDDQARTSTTELREPCSLGTFF